MLYVLLFLLPQLFLSLDLGFYFWAMLAVSFMLGIYAFRSGSHMLQFYFIFFVFTLLLGYFIQFFVGVRFLPVQLTPDSFDGLAAAVLSLHFIGLIVGSWALKKRRIIKNPETRLRSNIHFFYIGLIVWVSISAITFRLVGFEQFFSQRSELNWQEIDPMVSFLTKVAKASSFILVAMTITVAGKKMSFAKVLIIVVISGFALVLTNPTNTARLISLAGLVLVLVTYLGITKRSKQMTPFLVVAAYAAIILLPITSSLRHGFAEVSVTSFFQVYSSLEFSSIQLLLDGLKLSEQIDGGNLLLSGIAIIVPRSIFLDKAGAVGPEIAELSNYVFANAAVPSFFNAYLDFGLGGVLVFSIAMGYLFQMVHIRDNFDIRRRRDGYKAILLACTPMIARGDLSTAMISVYAFAASYEVLRLTALLTFRAPREDCTKWREIDNASR